MSKFEIKTVGQTVEIICNTTQQKVIIELDKHHWKIGPHGFTLYDFIAVIQDVTKELSKGFSGGKWKKMLAKNPNLNFKPAKWFESKHIRVIAKILSPELHKLIASCKKKYREFTKALHRCYGPKYAYLILEPWLNDKEFIKSKLCHDICKYRVACYAFGHKYLSGSSSSDWKTFDWKRYFCFKHKLNKNYIQTFKNINYTIPTYELIEALSKIKLERPLTTRSELYIYYHGLQHIKRRDINSFWDIILSVKDDEIKRTAKHLKKLGYNCDLRRKGYEKLIKFFTVAENPKSFYDGVMSVALEDIKKRHDVKISDSVKFESPSLPYKIISSGEELKRFSNFIEVNLSDLDDSRIYFIYKKVPFALTKNSKYLSELTNNVKKSNEVLQEVWRTIKKLPTFKNVLQSHEVGF